MTRLLIVEDHPIIVSGVELLLQGTGYELVGHVSRGGEAPAAIEAVNPDLVILDDRLPDKAGLDIFLDLRAKGDLRPVILFTSGIHPKRAIQAVNAGINGLLFKHSGPDHLLTCLDMVRGGGRWIEESVLRLTAPQDSGSDMAEASLPSFTAPEQAIIGLVREDLSNAEIAARLMISEAALRAQLHDIYERLGVLSRVDLVRMLNEGRMAHGHGLEAPDE